MYYRPELANGKFVKLSWPLYMYRLLNGICWPLEDNVGYVTWIFDRIFYIFGFLIFLAHNDAEVRYLYQNLNNIDDLLTGMPTYLVLIEVLFRAFQLGVRKERFKSLLKEYYAWVYIAREENEKRHQAIRMKLRPTSIVSGLYFSTLGLYLIITIMNVISNQREPIYKMAFPYDHRPLYIYYPIVLANLWVGLIVVTLLIGELNLVSEMMLHLNGRFISLREDIEVEAERLLHEANPNSIASDFENVLKGIIQRNVELYKFATKVQAEFSYRIFVWFAFSAGLLCVLGFKVYTNPREGIVFVCWCIAKILELTSVGEVGSTLIKTTDEISIMYYQSKWELIMERSSNARANVRLMKLVLIGMETSHKPIYLTGLNFFNVSLTAVLTILQGAGSYFTCLISIR